MRWIVSTRPDGGVSVTRPTETFRSFFTNGGAPKDYFLGITIDGQIASMVGRGVREDVAAAWMDGLRRGGYTDAEFYELIRDRDTPAEWTAKELWDKSDLPDRWFRNAWRRSHNGGPINIDLSAARKIQFREVKNAIDEEKKRRDLELFPQSTPLIDLETCRRRICAARCEEELRTIWPLNG